MNHSATEMPVPRGNRVAAAPRTDDRMQEDGRFQSDAGFRVDHYFCSRLNVTAVGSEPKSASQKAHIHNFTAQTDPRSNAKSRAQEACFATVAATTLTTDFNRMAAGTVTTELENLTEPQPKPSLGNSAPRVDGYTMAELEKLAITQTLERCAGNRTRAAGMLGLSVRTLQRKLNSWKRKCL